MNVRGKQRGATLIVGLVMLVVLTLLVISAIRSSNTNLRIAGNMQMQEEASTAAQQAIEQVISSNFTASPTAISMPVNVGAATYQVTGPVPTCTGSIAVTNADLNPANAADAPCISSGAAQQTGLMVSGVAGAGTFAGQSWCYLQQWELRADVSDAGTGATASTFQGVSMRVPAGTACP